MTDRRHTWIWKILALFALANPALAQLGPPVFPPGNPFSPQKAVLGEILFFEEQLSSDNTMACATCHIPSAGGVDPRTASGTIHPGLDLVLGTPDDKNASAGIPAQDNAGHYFPESTVGFGFEPQVTERQAISHIGAGLFPSLLWDASTGDVFVDPWATGMGLPSGAALEAQCLGPLFNTTEMGYPGRTFGDIVAKLGAVAPMHLAWNLPPNVSAALAATPTYPGLFNAAFGTPAINPGRIAHALATYMRTQHPDQTPFDLGTLTPNQSLGLSFFTNPGIGNCAGCHALPTFSDGALHRIAVRPDAEDPGAGGGFFRAPSLRNVGLRKFFFHNGDPSIPTMNALLNFYNNRKVSGIPGLAGPLFGINMNPAQMLAIEDFLVNGLTDPRVAAETFPFDRPSLNSERATPQIVLRSSSTPGAGGNHPQIIAEVPPNIGSLDFKFGVHNAEGGAMAQLEMRAGFFAGWSPVGGPILLGGTPGVLTEGFGTKFVPIPAVPAMVGTRDWFRWLVIDSTGVSRTRRARVTYL